MHTWRNEEIKVKMSHCQQTGIMIFLLKYYFKTMIVKNNFKKHVQCHNVKTYDMFEMKLMLSLLEFFWPAECL